MTVEDLVSVEGAVTVEELGAVEDRMTVEDLVTVDHRVTAAWMWCVRTQLMSPAIRGRRDTALERKEETHG